MIVVGERDVEVDAGILAHGLDVSAECVTSLIRKGEITCRCESGVDEDSGRYRLTFFYAGSRFRLIVDSHGAVIQRSTVSFRDRPLPPSLRRPGV